MRYKCLPGHQLASGKVSSLFCSNGRFVIMIVRIIIMKFTMVRNVLLLQCPVLLFMMLMLMLMLMHTKMMLMPGGLESFLSAARSEGRRPAVGGSEIANRW